MCIDNPDFYMKTFSYFKYIVLMFVPHNAPQYVSIGIHSICKYMYICMVHSIPYIHIYITYNYFSGLNYPINYGIVPLCNRCHMRLLPDNTEVT